MTSRRQWATLALGLALAAPRPAMADDEGEHQVTAVGTGGLVAVETPEKDGVKVYVVNDGTWSVYRAPRGIRARPAAGPAYIAVMPEGPKITQVAAFSEQSRSWIVLDLPEPAEGKLWGPVLAPNMAVYVAGRRVYAFSAPASRWGVLELPEGAKPQVLTTGRYAQVVHGDRLYVFNARFGRWDNSGDPAPAK